MKRLVLLISSIIILLLVKTTNAQWSLGVSQQGIIGLPDSVFYNDNITFSYWVVNKGDSVFTGDINTFVIYPNDSTPTFIDSSSPGTILPGDSFNITTPTLQFSAPNFNNQFNNIIVIWPSGIAPTTGSIADSITSTVYVDTCNIGYNYTVDSNLKIIFNNTSYDPYDSSLNYFWDFGDSTNSTIKHPIHQYSLPGTYNVCLTATRKGDSAYCKPIICKSIAINPTGIEKTKSKVGFINIYPNPAKNKLYINSSIQLKRVRIFNILGSVVHSLEKNQKNIEILISELHNAVYFLEIIDMNNNRIIKKFIKK